jgi:hypothetical protein
MTMGHLTFNGDTVQRLDSYKCVTSVQYFTAQGNFSCARSVSTAPKATSCAQSVTALKATEHLLPWAENKAPEHLPCQAMFGLW